MLSTLAITVWYCFDPDNDQNEFKTLFELNCEGTHFTPNTHTFNYFLSNNGNINNELFLIVDHATQVKLIDNKEERCLNIICKGDFNKNGFTDVLIEDVLGCGGNCCGNTYLIYSYDGKRFNEIKLDAHDWNGIDIDSLKDRHSFTVETDNEGYNNAPPFYKKETFELFHDSLVLKEQYIAKKIRALTEIRSDMFHSKNDTITLLFNLDQDKTLDTITCTLNYRWGRMNETKIHFGNGYVERLSLNTKRIGVLPSKTNGYHDLIIEFRDTLYWNKHHYSKTK